MTHLRGRCARGRRLHASAPCGRWRTTTMIGAVRIDGSTACMTIEGTTNTEVFRAYVKEVLLPSLKPDDILVRDNLNAHKDSRALEILAARDVEVRFLPPYSPDLNPIELMWSKVKNLLRGAEARDHDQLLLEIGKPCPVLPQRTPPMGLPIVVTGLVKML
ncbi:transposase [Haloferula luteola]|uniref:Transposase n=1 Tax=Haloferula luteola TaxID=595692 RepID=A0A840V548_9BACT|nr:transposase [Haloferula luteola]